MSLKFISAALSSVPNKTTKQKYALYNILRPSKAIARGRSETKSTCTLYETEICQASLKFWNFFRTVNKPKLKGLGTVGKRKVIPLIDKQITDKQSQVLIKSSNYQCVKMDAKVNHEKSCFQLKSKNFFQVQQKLFCNFHMNW